MRNHPNLNILQYWKENRHRFGVLTYMAMDVLSIPKTTVASKCFFNIGSHIINKYRSCLFPNNPLYYSFCVIFSYNHVLFTKQNSCAKKRHMIFQFFKSLGEANIRKKNAKLNILGFLFKSMPISLTNYKKPCFLCM